MKVIAQYEPFAKSVEEEDHTALGAAPLERIEDQELAVPCTEIDMDPYFNAECYPLQEPITTLHEIIKKIQAIIAQDFHRAHCNFHAITDLCIEVIDLYDNGTAYVYIGS